MYVMRNAEGLYLNSDYHTRWTKGLWRPRANARLYRSLQGIRSAFNAATPAVKKYVGVDWQKPAEGTHWTDEDREHHRAFWRAVKAIKTDKYLQLIAEDGYVVEEVEINL